MYFKGDIIITDPCYIIRENPHPFIGYDKFGISPSILWKKDEELTEEERKKLKDWENTPYKQWERENDDWDKCDYGHDMSALGFTSCISDSTIYGDWSCETYKIPYSAPEKFIEEATDIAISLINTEHVSLEEAKKLETKLEAIYSPCKKIGHFCADAGMVGVFLLNEVLKYNPDFNYHIKKPWTTTLIRDFEGDIEYYIGELGAHILGKGNINFVTVQS